MRVMKSFYLSFMFDNMDYWEFPLVASHNNELKFASAD